MKTKNDKREEAVKRQEAYDKLTPLQKIIKLDKKFGKGKGAEKERAKLSLKGNKDLQKLKTEQQDIRGGEKKWKGM